MHNRLYRSRIDQKVAGVCSGLGRSLSIDPTLIRLFFILLTFGTGLGVLAYVILWLVLPYEDQAHLPFDRSMAAGAEELASKASAAASDLSAAMRGAGREGTRVVGVALILLGLFFLLRSLGFWWPWWMEFDVFWPALLILAGGALFVRRTMQPGENRARGLLFPVLLVSAGALLLLGNLGLIGWRFWAELSRFWPVLLIAIGLESLFGRRSGLGSVLAAGALIAALAAAVFYSWSPSGGPGVVQSGRISQSLEGARQAEVEIDMGAGRLRLGALHAHSGLLVEGDIGARQQVATEFEREGDTARLKLEQRSFGPLALPADFGWKLGLNPDVPMSLEIKTGASESILDLGGLKLVDLAVRSGVGHTELHLPGEGAFAASVEGGVGAMEITIPREMEARIRVSNGIGNIEVRGDFIRDGGAWVTRDFGRAANRVELTVKGGVGAIEIRQR